MESAFEYSKYVTGKNYLGRIPETQAFASLLLQGENIAIYEPPKTGKMSLIQQAFVGLKSSSVKFLPVFVDLLAVRSIQDVVLAIGSSIIKACGSTPSDYDKLVRQLLPGSHFTFDGRKYEKDLSVLSLTWEMDIEDIRAVLSLPYRVAEMRSEKVFLLLDEFQNIMHTEDSWTLLRLLEKSLEEHKGRGVSFIFCGSQHNAMHEIFGVRKFFFRQVERIQLSTIEPKLIIDHIVKGLLASGKVIDRNLMLKVCELFRCNIWYINHFTSICDALTRGYIMEPVINSALKAMLAIHEPRFKAIMADLTGFQVNMLRAVLCGHSKFTSSEVIEQFSLSSSANVKRLREALSKKEIVDFSGEKPTVLDPLFEYWARTEYYKITPSESTR